MARFYINDSAVRGARIPKADYRKAVRNLGSDCLNEAQAIARGRKITKTKFVGCYGPYVGLMFLGNSVWGSGIALNEVELWDDQGVNRIAGRVVSALWGSQNTQADQTTVILTDGNKGNDTTYNRYCGFLNPAAGTGFIWDLGGEYHITSITIWSASYSGSYAPTDFCVKSGASLACSDYTSPALYNGYPGQRNVTNTVGP